MGCRGGRGRSPKGQASLPREQEAEPRPADLLLEVRGLGRPSRPHFLQPRPTPCGPRVYGNSGLDGFSEIIFSLCPRLTPPAPKGTQAGRPERCGEGMEPFPGGPWPRSDPSPEISFFKCGSPGSGSEFSFSPAESLPGSWELLRAILYRGETRGCKGPRDFAHASGQEILATQFATLAQPPQSPQGLQNFSASST